MQFAPSRRLVVSLETARLGASAEIVAIREENCLAVSTLESHVEELQKVPLLRNTSSGNQKAACLSAMTTFLAPGFVNSGHTLVEVPHLVKVLENPRASPGLRAMIALILGPLTAEGKAAIPALKKLLDDDDELVRRAAASSILQIELDPELVPEVAGHLRLGENDREEFGSRVSWIVGIARLTLTACPAGRASTGRCAASPHGALFGRATTARSRAGRRPRG